MPTFIRCYNVKKILFKEFLRISSLNFQCLSFLFIIARKNLRPEGFCVLSEVNIQVSGRMILWDLPHISESMKL